MKKIVVLILITFLLTGCGAIKKISKEKTGEKYSLVSTSDRLVFQDGDNYEVIYFENEKIVKVESAIKFKTEEEAKDYYLKENYGNNDTIKLVGDTFILEQLPDYFEDYKDLNKGELEEYMKSANYIKK